MSRPAPLCRDCRHFKQGAGCGRQPAMVNAVTGEQFYPSCETERAFSVFRRFLHHRSCGPEGLYFEAGGPVQFRWETPVDGLD